MQETARKKRLRFKNRLFWSVFSRALSCLLILNFTGIPTALAVAESSAVSATQIEKEGNDLSKELSRLLFIAKNPNTLSAGPANPAALKRRVSLSDSAFFTWKGHLESFLASGKPEAEGALGSAVTFYFEQAIKLVELKALQGDSGSYDAYDFTIPYQGLKAMSGFDEGMVSPLVIAMLSNPSSMIALDASSVRGAVDGDLPPEHPVKLQIGREFAAKFVLAAKGGLSDEHAFVTVLKSLAAGELIDQWEQIDTVRKTPKYDFPRVAAKLMTELGIQPELKKKQRYELEAESARRADLIGGYRFYWFENDRKEDKPDPKLLTQNEFNRLIQVVADSRQAGLEFSDEAFLEGYTKAVGLSDTDEARAEQAATLESLRQAESLYIHLGLEQAMAGYPLPLHTMSQAELKGALRKILGQAKFLAILPILEMKPAPKERDAEVDAYLNASLAAFEARIPEHALDFWISSAEPLLGEYAKREPHIQFVEEMLRESVSADHEPPATDLKSSIQYALDNARADSVTLSFDLVKRFARLTQDYGAMPYAWKKDLEAALEGDSWTSSVQAYRLLVSRLEKGNSKVELFALRTVAHRFGLSENGAIGTKLTVDALVPSDRTQYWSLKAPVDFELVKRTARMTGDYQSLPESARSDLEIILKAEDWKTSRQAFGLLLEKIYARISAAQKSGNSALAKSYSNEIDALWRAASHFALGVAHVTDPTPRLGDLPEGDRGGFLAVSDSLKLNNSLLTVELEKDRPLFKDLAALEKTDSARAFPKAEELIERGIEVLRGNIQKDFDKLGAVAGKDPKDQIKELLPLIARSTLLKIELPKAFPMLADQIDAAVDSYLKGIHDRGILAEGKDALMKPMSPVMFIFMTRMLLMAFRPTAPLVRAVTALETGIGTEMQGYFIATLPLILADAGIDYAEYREAKSDERETRDWFNTSAEATSFYDYFSVADSATRTETAWDKFYSSAKQQLLFIGVPILAGFARPEVIGALDSWRIRKLERLGFTKAEVENFNWSKDEIVAHARKKLDGIKANELYSESRRSKENQVEEDANSLLGFIDKQEKTARQMMKDFEREFRDLGIPKGKETLVARKLHEAKSIMEAKYRAFQINRKQLERAERAYNEIIGIETKLWSQSMSPIRHLIYKYMKTEPPRGPKEILRERLLAQIYGFMDYRAQDFTLGGAPEVMKDYYAALGVTRAATDAEIKSAYYKAARASHPDLNSQNPNAEEDFKKLQEAYGVLSNPLKKSNYDSLYDEIRGNRGTK